MGKFVTMTEIGEKLGVSHSTVSRALSGHPKVSEDTRKLVMDLAAELGYYANNRANLLSEGTSKIIAVIIPDISIYFFSKILQVIHEELTQEGFSVLMFNSNESLENEINAVDRSIEHRVDGIIAAISVGTHTFDHFEKVLKYDIPLIFYDRVAHFLPVPKVIAKDYDGAYLATKYLIETGCKIIAHITASQLLNNSNNRLYGYMDALKDHGLEVEEDLIHYFQFDPDSIRKFLNQTLDTYPNLDGLFVFNDYCANYAINILNQKGKNVPDDISVIGFSDEPIATYMTPQLTTVHQIAPEMGRLTAKKMVAILKSGEPVRNEKILIDQKLVIRDTTLPQ